MLSLLTFLTTNAESLLAFVLATQAAAQVVVNLTPTPKDNEALARFYRSVEFLAGIWTLRAKQ